MNLRRKLSPAYMQKIGSVGGSSRSKAKRVAALKNLAKANRVKNGGGK
jgi:hypothetical protein